MLPPWYQGDVRVLASCVALAVCAGCASPDPAPPAPTSSAATTPAASAVIDTGQVGRTRALLPPGFDFGGVPVRVAPVALWGLGAQWVAEPQRCAVLAEPPIDTPAQGWSASGPGAIVYVVVAASPVTLDDAVRAECGTFAVQAGHTSGVVRDVGAPAVDGAATLGLRVDATTVVEGGTETHSQAQTLSAYLPGHLVSVTVVTDPGSTGDLVGADVPATLLSRTVSALRGER